MGNALVVRLNAFGRICPIGGYEADKIKIGASVIVKTDRGLEIGKIEAFEQGVPRTASQEVKLKKVLRYATDEDLAKAVEIDKKAKELLVAAKKKAHDYELKIKCVASEILFDETHGWVYYVEEEEKKHSQTRDLARDVATSQGIKVDFKQLNQRDAAKMIGGLGHCGLSLCCRQWLDKPKHVTVKMVKEQGLPVSPSKTSGQCGRLMCCLAYEHEPKAPTSTSNQPNKAPSQGEKR